MIFSINQIIAIALGGAFGAVFRFVISSGIYQWLGRGFPYGTLTVNIIGSLLIGLMSESLLLQRVAFSAEYRSAIIVGLLGSLTTFSTFSLDSLILIEQGQWGKVCLNILLNVFMCILAAWIGFIIGKILFLNIGGGTRWLGWTHSYSLLVVNLLGAFLIGISSSLLLYKSQITIEYGMAISIVAIGVFITLSCLYLALYFIEYGYPIKTHFKLISATLIGNTVVGVVAFFLGIFAGRQL